MASKYTGALFDASAAGFKRMVQDLNVAHAKGYEPVGPPVRLDKKIAVLLQYTGDGVPVRQYESMFGDEG